MNQSQPQNQRRLALILVLAGGALLLLAALALIYQNASPETGAEAPPQEDLPYPEVSRISVDEAHALAQSGAAVVLDVRSVSNFENAHIPGAVSMPAAEVQVRIGELSKDQEILTYCTWPNEESSARAASILLENGFTNVHALRGGFEAWVEAGFPTESGP